MIAAEGGDAPAQTVLVSVTRPLEQALSTIPDLELMQSQTTRGSAGFTLTFKWGTDAQQALQLVNARIANVQSSLPAGLHISAERLNPTIFPILDYSITSSVRSLADLRTLALYTIRPRLARLPGVARVIVDGGQVQEYLVTVTPDRLAAQHVSVAQVTEALQRANTITAVGNYDNHSLRHLVLVNGLLDGAEAIQHVVVVVKDRVPVTVGDVATVEEAIQRQTVLATGSGQPAVLLNIVRQPDGNTIKVAQEVKQEVAGLSTAIPSDVRLTPFYDQSQIVQESESSVVEAIVLGGALALIVLMLFLGNGRAAFTALSLLPLTLVITFGVMKAVGLDLNIMTLGALAIALGLVIDDSIVVVEHIYHHLERGVRREDAVPQALQEITPAMLASSAASMVTFLPLVFLPGVTGNFFSALAITMIATLAVSLLLAIIVCPTIAMRVLPREIKRRTKARSADGGRRTEDGGEGTRREGRSADGGRRTEDGGEGTRREGRTEDGGRRTDSGGQGTRDGGGTTGDGRRNGAERHLGDGHHPKPARRGIYDRLARWCLSHRPWVLLALIPLAVGTYVVANRLQTGFMPEFDEGAFVLDYKMPPGTSLAETNRVMQQVEGILAHEKGVAAWSRLTGAQSGSGLEITPQNQGDMLVRLTKGNRPPVDDITADLRVKVQAAVPNLQVDFAQILGDLIGDLSGSPAPIEVKIFGPDINVLRDLSHQVGQRISAIHGVVDEFDGIVESGPQTEVHVDPVRAAEAGLSTDTITAAVTAALDGTDVGAVLKGEILEPIQVKYPGPPEPELDAQMLAAMPILNPSGQPVPLASVATVGVEPGLPDLNRENQRLMDSVTARLEGIDLGTGVKEVKAKLADLLLPPGYTIEYGGLYKSQQQSFHDLAVTLALAILFVVSVLIIAFRSFRVVAALLGAAILSLSGVVMALAITGTPLNISSFTGAIMIVGIVTENGVLLFDELQRLQRAGTTLSTEDLLHVAGKARLRPILMTTFAAILALLPLSFGIGAGAAMQKPLAVAVIGGLTLSMLFTLILAPVIYASLSSFKIRPPKAG